MNGLVSRLQTLIIDDKDPDVDNAEGRRASGVGKSEGEAKEEKGKKSDDMEVDETDDKTNKGEVIDLDVEDIFASPAYENIWYYLEPEDLAKIGDAFDGVLSVEGYRLHGRAPCSKKLLDEVIQQAAGTTDGKPYALCADLFVVDDEDVNKHPFFNKIKVETKMGSLRIMPNTGASFSPQALFAGLTYGSTRRSDIPDETDEEFKISKKLNACLRHQIGGKNPRHRGGGEFDGYRCDDAGWVDIDLESQYIWTQKDSQEAQNERYHRKRTSTYPIGKKRTELLMKLTWIAWINGSKKNRTRCMGREVCQLLWCRVDLIAR